MAGTDKDRVASGERRWAVVRVGLGMAQMIGALTSLILLVQTGASTLSVTVVSVTALFMLVSLLLFRGK